MSAVSLAAEVVATGCGDKLVRLFAIDGGLLLRTLVGHGGPVFAICIRDGVIVSGARDNTVRVWSMEEQAPARAVLKGHSESEWESGLPVCGVAIAPGGGRITSMNFDEVLAWQPIPKPEGARGAGRKCA